MKKYFLLPLLAVLGFAFASCSDDKDEAPTTYTIHLSIDGEAALSEAGTDGVTVNVLLNTAATEALDLNFTLSNNSDGVLVVDPATVSIPAGQKTATFTVRSAGKMLLSEQRTCAVELNSDKATIEHGVSITVRPALIVGDLTEAQLQLVRGYLTRYGLNLTDFLGEKTCDVRIVFPNADSESEWYGTGERSFTAKTVIAMSDASTEDTPVLAMADNPLGLTSFLWEIMKDETFGNYDYWNNEYTKYPAMLDALNFDADAETFAVTLDGLSLDPAAKTINFLAYDEENGINIVPFAYNFSAQTRWEQMAASGAEVEVPNGWDEDGNPLTASQTVQELLEDEYVTFSPAFYLTYSDLAEDGWENDPTDWIEPTASYDTEAGTITFAFPWDHQSSGGYTQIYVTVHLK